jgi:hypothetical protein
MYIIIGHFADDTGHSGVPHSDDSIPDTGKFISKLDFVPSKLVGTKLKMLMA